MRIRRSQSGLRRGPALAETGALAPVLLLQPDAVALTFRITREEMPMRVGELMAKNIQTCGPHDSLQQAAQIMWDRDCGIVPVVDDERRVIAMITDRDVCMACFTKNRAPLQIRVSEV